MPSSPIGLWKAAGSWRGSFEATKVDRLDRLINLDYVNQYGKIGGPLPLRPRASAELAISPATLYAYVSRGLIRSEPSSDSRSHRYRAEDVRSLKERRTPSPEPRGPAQFRR